MNETLKSAFTKEQIALAATLGAKSESLEDKMQQLFANLPDPLLSAEDVHELLASPESLEDVRVTLKSLVEKKTLESSDQTLRPLDEEGVTLYRQVNVPFTRLKLVAVESELNDGSTRYQFTCDGRIIRSIARVSRLDALADEGNQRGEIHKHVAEIAKGVKDGTQIPNSILLVMIKGQVAEVNEGDSEEDIPAVSFGTGPTERVCAWGRRVGRVRGSHGSFPWVLS